MLFFSLFQLFACDIKTDGSSFPSCDEVDTALDSEEETLFGFTPQEAADSMPISSTVGLEWDDGTVDCLHYTLQLDPTSARNVDSSPAPIEGNGPVPSIHIECNDYVAIDGYVNMSTPNGEINEEISLTLIYTLDNESGEVLNSFTVMSSSLNGSYEPSNADSSAQYLINGAMNDGLFTGELLMQTSEEDGDIAWAENSSLAEWGIVDVPAHCQNDNE